MENTPKTNRRNALGLIAGSVTFPFFSQSAQAKPSLVLIELFTSQGCSSCPPADKLAGALKKQPGVTVVTFNVDYWDYLGWRDTLAKPEYTQRQYDYAASMGESGVYTPQMIINGVAHVVGSQQRKIDAAVEASSKSNAFVDLRLTATDTEFIVDIAEGKAIAEATLWIMSIVPEVSVGIERGENTGKKIVYHNVVNALVPAGMWTGKSTRLTLPRKAIVSRDTKGVIAVLQEGKVGRVLGLQRWGDVGA